MTAAAELGATTVRPLGVGDALRTAIAVLQRNAKAIALLAFFWVMLPEAVIGLILSQVQTRANSSNSVASILAIVFTGAVAHLVIRDLEGQPVDWKAAQRVGMKLFLALLGLSILAGLGVVLGMLLLIVPGIILALMWSVALPSRVAEGPGVMAAFHRSRVLTKGNRWPVFLVFLVSLAPTAILAAVAGVLSIGVSEANPLNYLVVSPLLVAAISAIYAVLPPVLYVKLGGGGGAGTVASVFD